MASVCEQFGWVASKGWKQSLRCNGGNRGEGEEGVVYKSTAVALIWVISGL